MSRAVLLLEPGYRNKYPPLGLMKIASYHRERGDAVVFSKGESEDIAGRRWDRIYVTTLFSFEFKRTARAINFAIEAADRNRSKVFVGGISASLMPVAFRDRPEWGGVRVITGLLDKTPTESLQLTPRDFDYSRSKKIVPIEDRTPDYSILNDISYQYHVHDAYFYYATRGCVRKCSFCGVPRVEGGLRDMASITDIVGRIKKAHGEKRDLVLMDNNVTASPRFKDVIQEIVDLGFVPGATLKRNGRLLQRRVDFNQGVDARLLAKTPMFLEQMARICLSPLRIAFDHVGLRKPYETSVRYANAAGITRMSNYMLYNFHDSPEDLYERMRINIDLNEELGVRIYSFPMRYQPVDLPDRSHIGPKWSKYQLRSLQIVLHATHGVVSGEPEFFKYAFGANAEAFEDLLLRPHHMIFNRIYYSEMRGRRDFARFSDKFSKLTSSDKTELIALLSSCTASGFRHLRRQTANPRLLKILSEYIYPTEEREEKIREARKRYKRKPVVPSAEIDLTPEEVVEDAEFTKDVKRPPKRRSAAPLAA